MRFAPAAERNREPILAALRDELDERLPGAGPDVPLVLELGAGTGQHVCHFARALPHVRFRPTEHPSNLADLVERVRAEGSPNIEPPLALDVAVRPWPVGRVGLCYSANTIHMMRDADIEGLFGGAADCLELGGKLCMYGPFAIDGEHTGQGNRAFDATLRARDPGIGIRDLVELDALATRSGLAPTRRRSMPSDNRFVVWTKSGKGPARQRRTAR